MNDSLSVRLPRLDDRMKSFGEQICSFVNFISLIFGVFTTFVTPINYLNLKVIIVIKCRDMRLLEALLILEMK